MKKLFAFLAIFSLFLGINATVLAQAPEPPSGPPAGVQQGPESGEIPSGPPAGTEMGPQSGEVGGEGQMSHNISKPEVPGIPAEARNIIPDSDFIQVYCLMTKWKTGEFFAAIDSLKENLLPAMEKVKEMGVDITVPDMDGTKSEAQGKLDSICNATTVEAANSAIDDFYNFGVKFDKSTKSLNSELDTKLRAKGDALKDKVNSEINPFVEEQKTKMNDDIESFADGLAADFDSELRADLAAAQFATLEEAQSFVASRVASFEISIRAQINTKVEAKEKELQAAIEAKVQEVIGPEKAKFEDIGNLFKDMGNKIQAGIASRQSQYEQYKDQAFAKRKEIVFKIVDKSIEQGLAELEKDQSQIAEAQKEDPTVKSVDEIKSELAADRKALEAKLDAALAAGNETAFQSAVDDFRAKWENFRTEMEKTASQAVLKICTVALAQFQAADSQIDQGLQKIQDLISRCAGKSTDECLKVIELGPRFNTLTTKLTDLKNEISTIKTSCQSPETADRKNLVALLNKIKSDGEDVKIYGEAFEAEKLKIIAESAKQICDQVLPQLAAAQTEITKNDLAVLQGNIDKCKGKTTDECGAVNKLVGDFAGLKGQIANFNTDTEKVKELCSKVAKEEDFKSLSDSLNELKSEGDVLRKAANDLLAKQSEKMSEKILCQAVIPQLEGAKQEIASGLAQMNKLKSGCAGRSDARCNVINSNGGKFDALANQAQGTLGKIANVNSMCAVASADKFNQGLADAMNSIKNDRDTINKMVLELKTLEAEAGKNAGITIEAEDESSASLLPRTEQWHSIKGKSTDSWRPPLFGTGYWYLSRGGESLTYNFTASKDGQYNIWVRDYVDNFQPRGVRIVVINFDGKKYGAFPENTAVVPANNKIGVIAWHKVGASVALKAGPHVMKITKEATTSGAAIIDSFYLTTGSEVPPEK